MRIANENVRPFDCDGCLIVDKDKSDLVVDVVDPIDPAKVIKVGVNKPMVRLLREECARGSYIVVWSRGGHQWASNIVYALKIEDCVSLILSKPIVYFDDIPVQEWLKDRVFIEPHVKYKE